MWNGDGADVGRNEDKTGTTFCLNLTLRKSFIYKQIHSVCNRTEIHFIKKQPDNTLINISYKFSFYIQHFSAMPWVFNPYSTNISYFIYCSFMRVCSLAPVFHQFIFLGCEKSLHLVKAAVKTHTEFHRLCRLHRKKNHMSSTKLNRIMWLKKCYRHRSWKWQHDRGGFSQNMRVCIFLFFFQTWWEWHKHNFCTFAEQTAVLCKTAGHFLIYFFVLLNKLKIFTY